MTQFAERKSHVEVDVDAKVLDERHRINHHAVD